MPRSRLPLLLCLLLAPLGAQEVPFDAPRHQATLARLAEASQGDRPADAVALADYQTRTGLWQEAEATLQAVLKAHPHDVPALAAQGRLSRRRMDLPGAVAQAARLQALNPEHPDVLALCGQLALDRMDFAAARTAFRALLAQASHHAVGQCGLAEAAYLEDRMDEAQSHLRACLEAHPAHARAWMLQSLLHRARQENDAWKAAGRKAVACDPLDDEARANLANVLMRGEKKLKEGHGEYRIALRLNPLCHSAHLGLGNGWNERDGTPPLPLPADPALRNRVESALARGDAALVRGDLEAADRTLADALELQADLVPALIGRGSAAYRRGDLEGAQAWFQKALVVDPDDGLAHYGMSLVLLRLKDRINIRLTEIERHFASLDVPEAPGLREVITTYATLDPELQRIVRLSVQPLQAWLPLLRDRKLTFHIFPLHHRLWQVPHHEALKGTRTFDGRLWDDVKGAGGEHASAGAEWQRDVKYLRFNVLTHELAHQVHGQLPKQLRQAITRLYRKAKATRRTLDFYSDSNEMEYFAVGVEAYVSHEKLADQKITYGHTRQELARRDPELYAFIRRLGQGHR